MIKLKRLGILIAIFAIFLTMSMNAETFKHFKMTAQPSKSSLKAGEEAYIKVNIDINKYYYTYSFLDQTNSEGIGPTVSEIGISPNTSFETVKTLFVDKPGRKYDEGFEQNIDYYKGKAEFLLKVVAKKDVDFSKSKIYVSYIIQLCDTSSCLPPEEFKSLISAKAFEMNDALIANKIKLALSKTADGFFKAVVDKSKDDGSESVAVDTVAQVENTAKTENKPAETEVKAANVTESQAEIEQKKQEGVWSFLWFAMTAGALALLTPCVFPMVPITVSFFTKRAEKGEGNGLRDSVIYAVGIIATFTALGFLLALIFGATGIRDFAANGWVNLFIAVIFIVFSLNLFGAFEIQLPTGLMNKLNQKSQGSGIVSVLLMGLTFSLTSFTCTVPFVGSALISASGGEWFYPIIGMLGFSGVFAAPFFLLALFPSVMTKLPRAGGWMNNVKVVMGFLEIAAAIKFISNADLVWAWGILPKEMFLAIWIACGIMIVLYILGKIKLNHDAPVNSVGSPRLIFATMFIAITVWLVTGLFGKALGELDAFLPPPDYDSISGSTSSAAVVSAGAVATSNSNDFTDWYKDYNQAVAEAKKQNKMLFVDFTGFTCTNCRWMETKMFPLGEVKTRLDQFVKVKLFTDRNQEPYLSNKKLQEERYGSIELPLYVIMKPTEELVGTNTFTRDKDAFIQFLDKGLNALK